jgi:hypothetical protein
MKLILITLVAVVVGMTVACASAESPSGPTAIPTKDVFAGSTGKLPAGVTKKVLDKDATQCEWIHKDLTTGQTIISLHVTSANTILGGAHGHNGVYRAETGQPWEYVPFFADFESDSLVWDMTSSPSGWIYTSLINLPGDLTIPDQEMEIPPPQALPSEPTPTPDLAPKPTPVPKQFPIGRGLIVSDDDGKPGSWTNSKIYQHNLFTTVITEDDYLYVAKFSAGLGYSSGYVEGYPVALLNNQLPGKTFYRLIHADGYLFGAITEGGILRVKIKSDGTLDEPVTSLSDKQVLDITYDIYSKQIFAATRQSGIFRSKNNGKTWVSKSHGLPEPLKVELPSYSTEAAIMATQTGLFFTSIAGVGVFVSGDNAESWHPLGTFNNLLQPVVLSLASIDGGGLIAGTTNGIYGYPKKCISKLIETKEDPRRKDRRR